MLIYSELIELRESLVNGDISVKEAEGIYWKDHDDKQRSWHTPDWKKRRDEIIKDECEICGSNELLTLQHQSHPKKYHQNKKELIKKYTDAYIDSDPFINKEDFVVYIRENYDYVPVPLCPECESSNPSIRVRKLPKYRCKECKHEFEEPLYKSPDELISIYFENEDALEVRDKCFISKDEWKNRHNLSYVKYWMQRGRAETLFKEEIAKEAFMLTLDDNIKYLSFEDTITACKKCASYYDLNCMELCPKCKKHYKGIKYPTCIHCLPEDRRKEIFGNKEFADEMREVEKGLGID